MDKLVKLLLNVRNVRVVVGEVGATIGFLGLVAFGTSMAWEDFIAPLLR